MKNNVLPLGCLFSEKERRCFAASLAMLWDDLFFFFLLISILLNIRRQTKQGRKEFWISEPQSPFFFSLSLFSKNDQCV